MSFPPPSLLPWAANRRSIETEGIAAFGPLPECCEDHASTLY